MTITMPDHRPVTRGHRLAAAADPARRTARVLVVEDHRLLAESLEIAIGMTGYDTRMRSPEAGTTPKALLAWILRQRPQVVLLDLNLGALGDSTRLMSPLAHAGIKVVVLTASTDQVSWGGCLANGASTVLSKSSPLSDILAVVRRLTSGQPVLATEDRERLIRLWKTGRLERRAVVDRLRTLTRREQVVLGHLQRGRPVREIAEMLVVSEATVRTQVKAILAKLEVSSQLAAVGQANAVDWVPPAEVPPAIDVSRVVRGR